MLEKVVESWEEAGLSPLQGPVLTGFSGGPDSTALVLVLAELGVEQRVVHFDHGLRPESGADAAWCRLFCEKRGLAHEVRELDVPAGRVAGESVEMAARRLRLSAWRGLSDARGGVPVALGHHEDDVVETMLMRMLRGANSSGLTGLRFRRVVEGVELWRPLLGVSRAEIEKFLEDMGVAEVLQDASNAEPKYLRNRVRGELLPLLRDLGAGDAGLRRTAGLLLADAESLEVLAAEDDLTVSQLRAMPAALRLRALREWGRRRDLGDLVLSGGSVRKLAEILRVADGERRRLELPDGRWLVFDKDRLLVETETQPVENWDAVCWNWRRDPVLVLPTGGRLTAELVSGGMETTEYCDVCWFDAGLVPEVLEVRARRPGERMTPFGADQPVRVKKLLANTGLPQTVRARAALVTCGASGEVFWLAPYRRGAAAPVTAETETVLRLSFSQD